MNNISSGDVYNIFCLFSPKSDISRFSASIERNIKDAFRKIGRDVELNRPVCCASAFEALSDCKNINIRFFSTEEHCFSTNILKYASHIAEHTHAINIEIVDINNASHLRKYDPDISSRTIVITSKELENGAYLESLIKTIVNPVHIYISYGNDGDNEARLLVKMIEKCVSRCLPYTKVVYDFQSKYKDDIHGLIEEIKNGEYVILIINEKYITSEYCMAEYIGIIEKSETYEDFFARVYPIILDSGEKIRSRVGLAAILQSWSDKMIEIDSIIQGNEKIAEKLNLRTEREFIERVIDSVSMLDSTLGRLLSFDKKTHIENRFSKIIWSIHEKMVSQGSIQLYQTEADLRKMLNEINLNCIY